MQFRCVSKSWKALLTTNHGFWRIHRNFHPHNSTGRKDYLLLIAQDSGTVATRKDYLLLVKASQKGNAPSHVTDLVTLPCRFIKMRYANGLVLGHTGLIIVPYPTIGIADFYFGFSPSTNEYKVVATHCIAGLLVFKIFTLGQGSWRNIMVDWHHLSFVRPPPSDFCGNSTVCVHGVLHWLASSHEAISLDIGDERFTFIPVPSYSQCKLIQRYKKIIEVDKCLCIVCENGMVWILKDYKHQVWVAETIKVPLPQCTTHTGEFIFDVFQNNFLQLYDRKSKILGRVKSFFPKGCLILD